MRGTKGVVETLPKEKNPFLLDIHLVSSASKTHEIENSSLEVLYQISRIFSD